MCESTTGTDEETGSNAARNCVSNSGRYGRLRIGHSHSSNYETTTNRKATAEHSEEETSESAFSVEAEEVFFSTEAQQIWYVTHLRSSGLLIKRRAVGNRFVSPAMDTRWSTTVRCQAMRRTEGTYCGGT